jgi:polysaccharide biosynthesis transport protein
MDTIDTPDANLPARLAGSSRLPAQAPPFPREVVVASAPSPVSSQAILRGLARNWWRILLLWMVISTPLAYLIYVLVEPTYEVFSTLRVEPTQPELFGPSLRGGGDERAFEPYLETQVNLILSDRVLDVAVAEPEVVGLPIIKRSNDPKTDIRKKLEVKIIPNTYLIRVALDSKDPNEAAQVVNAVVSAFQEQNREFNRGSNERLKKNLASYIDELDTKIQKKKQELVKLAEKGNVEFSKPTLNTKAQDSDQGPQPAFDSLSLDQYKKTTDQLLQTEIALIEAESLLQTKQTEAQGNSDLPSREETDKQLQAQIADEFKRDPAVVSIIQQIEETTEELEHHKGVARQGHDPARQAAEKRLAKLNKRYDDLWYARNPEIRQRLLVETGAPESLQTFADIKRKVAALKISKTSLMQLLNKFDGEKQQSSSDTVRATFLRDEINSLTNMYDQVHRKLEQLRFETAKDLVRIDRVDPASIPKIPSNNKRLKYMAIAPVGILFAILGLFMLLEVKAERVADPDLLSSRVQSEVFALPPLPTDQSTRKLSKLVADDQIDRFIQRLDHLRFAVCGDHSEIGLGRCILITSAVGGEGKTTLAAQLAARCGNAGISTLLIDADLRRAALCQLLDVPDSLGLSDVLQDKATVEKTVISVQGNTFYLLAAGTPIQDTSRVFQGRNFGMLIAQLRQLYDLIIIDSPPILPVPDALILGRWTDGVVLAARYDISRSPQVERARRQLDNAGIPVLGTVINGMRSADSYYGHYTYGRQRTSQPDSSPTV